MTITDNHQARARPRASRPRATLYEPASWVLLRAPLLPVAGPGAVDISDPRAGFGDPRVRRALVIGSPDLVRALDRPDASARDRQRAERKLKRYLIRMSSRPTPYGAFAGVLLAEWGPRTTVFLRESRARTRTRPDMGWLTGLIDSLEARPEVRLECRVRANSTALVHAGRVFLSETRPGHNESAVSIRATSAVRQALAAARTLIPYVALRDHLSAQSGGTPAQVAGLLTTLWRQGLLLDLRPPLTCESPARYLRDRLAAMPSTNGIAAQLDELLATADTATHAANVSERFTELDNSARAMHDEPHGSTMQVDLAVPAVPRALSAAIGVEAARAAELLLRLTPAPLGSSDLETYKHAFTSRYGHHREVPLLEMLDPEFGIGPFGHSHGWSANLPAQRSALLETLALTALRDGRTVVDLNDEMIAKLQTWEPAPATAPLSLDLSVFVTAPSAAAVDDGRFLLVVGPNLGASSAGRSLGRFADLLGTGGHAALRSLVEKEAQARRDNRLPVEVVYRPATARSGNVVVRPVVHRHEIILGVSPGVSEDAVIPLDDIGVRVRDNRFSLRWISRDVELLPSAKHMLNTGHAPTICRFLDEISRDGSPQLSPFDWGPAAGFRVLPRVQSGRTVLAPARWLLSPGDDGPPDWTADNEDFLKALNRWRQEWKVPRNVYLTVADNRLLLDLDDPEHVDQLRQEAYRSRDGGSLVLQEALPGPDDAWLAGEGGRFISELVVPLVLRSSPPTDLPAADLPTTHPGHQVATPTPSQRLRPPGSEWLYAKLYCPRQLENDLISGPLAEFCEVTETSGLADQWFFLRYADPEPHIRVRWRGDPEILTRHLYPEVCNWAAEQLADGLITAIAFDSYDRELERYGGVLGTNVSEEIFWADSRAATRLLALLSKQDRDLDRTELAVLTIDDLLTGLGLEDNARMQWYRTQQRGQNRAAGDDYRQRKSRLRQLLGDLNGRATLPDGNAVGVVLNERRTALAAAAQRLTAHQQQGLLGSAIDELYGSYIHLHCNRLLGSRPPTEDHLLGLLLRTHQGLAKAPLALQRPNPKEDQRQ